ncbi:hypothetical protein BDF19DRAFT_238633 [Syncephalis fuscata]|nr:hypothetical protein BDF19DRAFT_238633 [Syncephalis fuscata]
MSSTTATATTTLQDSMTTSNGTDPSSARSKSTTRGQTTSKLTRSLTSGNITNGGSMIGGSRIARFSASRTDLSLSDSTGISDPSGDDGSVTPTAPGTSTAGQLLARRRANGANATTSSISSTNSGIAALSMSRLPSYNSKDTKGKYFT